MKVGDLVELGRSETRKGLSWEGSAGIVIEITLEKGYSGGAVLVDFGGTIIKYAADRLQIISESEIEVIGEKGRSSKI